MTQTRLPITRAELYYQAPMLRLRDVSPDVYTDARVPPIEHTRPGWTVIPVEPPTPREVQLLLPLEARELFMLAVYGKINGGRAVSTVIRDAILPLIAEWGDGGSYPTTPKACGCVSPMERIDAIVHGEDHKAAMAVVTARIADLYRDPDEPPHPNLPGWLRCAEHADLPTDADLPPDSQFDTVGL